VRDAIAAAWALVAVAICGFITVPLAIVLLERALP
jgi:hypothetical protein